MPSGEYWSCTLSGLRRDNLKDAGSSDTVRKFPLLFGGFTWTLPY